MSVYVIEIQTIEQSPRLKWMPIYADSDRDRAIRWGNDLHTFAPSPKLDLRILEGFDGPVIGAWQEEGA